jgi:GGDEF domain-containing protein
VGISTPRQRFRCIDRFVLTVAANSMGRLSAGGSLVEFVVAMHGNKRLARLATAWPAPAAVSGIAAVCIGALGDPSQGLALSVTGAAASLVLARVEMRRLRNQVGRLEFQLAEARNQKGLLDPETGLGTLAALRIDWNRQLARYQRHGERFSVAVIDVHPTGGPEIPDPELLCAATDRLRTLTRIEDTIYRLAPGRLAVLLSGAATDGADAFLERAAPLLRVLELEPGGEPIAVTVSTDVVDWREGLGPFPEHRLLWDDSVHETATRIFKRWSGQRPAKERTPVEPAEPIEPAA